MNLLKLTDIKLAALRQEVVNECGRRTRMVVEGLDPAQLVCGNEAAKRAIVVAATGGHALLLMGPRHSGKTMLRAVAYALGLADVFEFWPCPCGEYGDRHSICRCTPAEMARHRRKMPEAEVHVEVLRPNERERRLGSPGTSLDGMRSQVAAAIPSELVSDKLDEVTERVFINAVREAGLDPAALTVICSVARTIAGLDRSANVRTIDMFEAINYRALRAYGPTTEASRPKTVRKRRAA